MSGRAWVFGDDIDTDSLAPGAWMSGGIDALAAHCLEVHDPAFAREVQPGDVLVAGRNFGTGSSREQAAQALRHLGIAAVVVRSVAGLFFRNAINLGLPVLVCPDAHRIHAGECVHADPETGIIRNVTRDERLHADPLPAHLLTILRDGGLLTHLEIRLAATRGAHPE